MYLVSSSRASANFFLVSSNCSVSSSFSSRQITLIHFGGEWFCFGCLPPKWGRAGMTEFVSWLALRLWEKHPESLSLLTHHAGQ